MPDKTKIITTDGPREWTDGVQKGTHLYGQWVIVSDGPGASHLLGKTDAVSSPPASKVVIIDGPEPVLAVKPVTPKKLVTQKVAVIQKHPLPDPQTSALAPAIPAARTPNPAWPLLGIAGIIALLFFAVYLKKRRHSQGF